MKKVHALIAIQYILFVLLGTFAPQPAQALVPQGGYVSFTFDDGYMSTFKKAAPILQKYDVRGTAYITTQYIGKSGYMYWNQVLQLQNTYKWEIGSHTLSHPELPKVNNTRLQREIVQSKQTLINKGLNVETFAFPYGAYDNRSLLLTNKHYSFARGFWDRDSLNMWPYSFRVLQVKSVEKGVSVSQIKAWIYQAKAENSWLILVYHDLAVSEKANNSYITKISELDEVVSYAKNNTTVLPTNEVLKTTHAGAIWQETFNAGLANWTDVTGAEINNLTNGQHPESVYSLQLTTKDAVPTAYVRSTGFNFPTTSKNTLYFYANTTAVTTGSFGVYMDEFNANGEWISGQLIGYVASDYVGNVAFHYTPTSENVVSTKIQFYVDGPGINKVFIDNISLYQY